MTSLNNEYTIFDSNIDYTELDPEVTKSNNLIKNYKYFKNSETKFDKKLTEKIPWRLGYTERCINKTSKIINDPKNFFKIDNIWDFNKNDHSAHSAILKNIYIRDDRPVFWQAVGINKLIIGKQIASLPNLHILLLHHEYSLKLGYINQANILHCLQVIVAYQMNALQIIFKAFAYLPIIGILFSLIANFIASIAIYITKILTHMLNQYVLQRQQDVDKVLLKQGQKTVLIQAIQSLLDLQIQDNLGRRLQNIEKYSRIT